MKLRNGFFLIILLFAVQYLAAQGQIKWDADGNTYTSLVKNAIIRVNPKTEAETVIITAEQLTPTGAPALKAQSYTFSNDNNKLLVFTNTKRVWRLNTLGDYWVLDIPTGKLKQIGKDRPAQSLMFAKFSPNGKKCAYVSEHNIFSEDLTTGQITKYTSDGARKFINGTFDWVYEEEFGCRDGFKWSPDGSKIAFWQVDATKTRDYYMLNTSDSIYSHVIPVEYPKVGESPSPVRIGVINMENGAIRFMQIDGDPQQHYIPRMDWSGPNELMVQQLDRKQQESKLIYCNTSDGSTSTFWAENDDAWVDLNSEDIFGEPGGFNWINNGADFIWVSEKDGWRHIYKISRNGKTETLLTKGNFDIGEIKCIDETNNYIYYTASPSSATQLYLYRMRIEDKASTMIEKMKGVYAKIKKAVIQKKAMEEPAFELLSAVELKGTHNYSISPGGKYAIHSFSNYNTPMVREWISLPDNKPLNPAKSIAANIKTDNKINVEYVQVTTSDNIVLDAWIRKPVNFDPSKKYPVVLFVYGEPASETVGNRYGKHNNFLYNGDMAADGYIQVGIDNRGTPQLKGAAWRKAIYRKIGIINIKDMAEGFMKLLEQNAYFDKDRTAVWGWSGGGSSTLNLMFQYPDLFKTGIAIAAVANQLFYDNIYQERYMGLPQENKEDFINGSPISHVQGLKGNLLYIHGTGDDNVHFSNAEALVNELVKYNKQFQYMAYPNRTHSISEGAGTTAHLHTLYTEFLRKNCAPGGR
jgi:dipeptidyl-peptidase-4